MSLLFEWQQNSSWHEFHICVKPDDHVILHDLRMFQRASYVLQSDTLYKRVAHVVNVIWLITLEIVWNHVFLIIHLNSYIKYSCLILTFNPNRFWIPYIQCGLRTLYPTVFINENLCSRLMGMFESEWAQFHCQLRGNLSITINGQLVL